MKTNTVFTTTLSTQLMNWLNSYAKKENVTKKAVIEAALIEYRKRLLESKLDEDTKALAKMTFDDLPSEDVWHDLQAEI